MVLPGAISCCSMKPRAPTSAPAGSSPGGAVAAMSPVPRPARSLPDRAGPTSTAMVGLVHAIAERQDHLQGADRGVPVGLLLGFRQLFVGDERRVFLARVAALGAPAP